MKRTKYIIANWKMNTTLSEAMVLAGGVLRRTDDLENVKVILLPPFLWLVPIKEQYKRANLGAQDIYSLQSGAFTGEISAEMLKGIAQYILVGHSERRSVFNETDADVNAKLHASLRTNIKPILAVGEENPMRLDGLKDDEITKRVSESRIGKSLISSTRGLSDKDWDRLIIAYEPVWAIGSGRNASGKYAAQVIRALRRMLLKKTNRTIATDVPILYGGSVTRNSVAEYAAQPTIDGVLVGSASLKISEFARIAEIFDEADKWRSDTNENN